MTMAPSAFGTKEGPMPPANCLQNEGCFLRYSKGGSSSPLKTQRPACTYCYWNLGLSEHAPVVVPNPLGDHGHQVHQPPRATAFGQRAWVMVEALCQVATVEEILDGYPDCAQEA